MNISFIKFEKVFGKFDVFLVFISIDLDYQLVDKMFVEYFY